MKKRIAAFLFICSMLLANQCNASSETAPILHVRQNGFDIRKIIQYYASDGKEINSILRDKKTLYNLGDDIEAETFHRDIYTIDDLIITVDEPDGEVLISWHSNSSEEFLRVRQELTAQYDPDEDGYLDDKETRVCKESFVPEEYVSPEILFQSYQTAKELADILELEIVDHYISCFALQSVFIDGQSFLSGSVVYGIKRNGLPVETAGLWSEVSRTGLFIKGESITINWIDNEIESANIIVYQVEKEEEMSGGYISIEQAQSKIISEIEKCKSAFNTNPYVDLCYMPTPDRKGMLYAILVPAWRFRFAGQYIEENNCHRVNAYTGEAIR